MKNRPIRDRSGKLLDRIPSGPGGSAGEGKLVGALGYFITSTVNGLVPVNGLQIGFNVQSHNVSRREGHEIHTFVINAYSKQIAEFLSEYRSAPSTVNFISGEEEVISVEPIHERKAASTWRIQVRRED